MLKKHLPLAGHMGETSSVSKLPKQAAPQKYWKSLQLLKFSQLAQDQ